MTATEKLEMIQKALTEGKTVIFANYLRAWKITPKTVANFAKAGVDLFKVKGKSLYMARGKNYDCMDYCAIRIN